MMPRLQKLDRRSCLKLGVLTAAGVFLKARSAYADQTGVYRCNDGGVYYFGIGEDNSAAWFGFNEQAGWANVFFGHWDLDGQIIRGMSGDWADIPWGTYSGNGQISIDFHPGAPKPDWHVRSKTGGFGGATWTRARNEPRFPALPQGNRDFPASSLNGVWRSDTGAFYYVREFRPGQVFWLAARPDLSAIHVARGTIDNNNVRVNWVDIPPSGTRSSGLLFLEVIEQGFMKKTYSNKPFGSERWTKQS